MGEDLRAKNDLMKIKQAEEIQSYAQKIDSLKEDKLGLKKEIALAVDEERGQMQKLQSVREEHEKARAKAERSLDDLTYGIKMYMTLGLEFQKCDGDCMKFIFSNVDPAHPEKKFYFLMHVDSEDRYQLGRGKKTETSFNEEEQATFPPLDPAYTENALALLNTNNDIGKFVCGMRRAFQKSC